jgi:hypothetical protein
MTPDTNLAAAAAGQPSLGSALLTGFAMMLVLEGLIYAGFPGMIRSMAEQVPLITDNWLRAAGIAAMIAGIGIIWLTRL